MASPRPTTSPAGLALIRAAEAFSPVVYLCPAGKRTIGYGHVLRGDESFPRKITREQAEALLIDDLAPVEIYLHAVFPDLPQARFNALVSLCFNIGLGAFEKSTLFARLKAGDIPGAAGQFGRWIYADGKILPGLVKRRAAERALFLIPETAR